MRHLRFTALVLALAMLLGVFPAALAEDAEIYSAPVEEAVGEATDLGDTGLVPEGVEIVPEATDAELYAVEAAPAEEIPAPELYDAPITSNGYTVDNGVLTAWSGDATSLTIPESLGVTVIGKECFKDNETLKSVTLPNGVTTIGEGAFLNCPKLKTVKLPETVTTVNAVAFMNCSALENITLPRSAANFGTTVFEGCAALKGVKVYDGTAGLQYCIDNEIPYTLIEEVKVEGVQLSKVDLSLKMGQTATLTATVLPSDATNTAVSWSSGNPAVATVKNGVVTAVAPGTAIITVVCAGDASKTAICTVTVSEGIAVSNLILSQSYLTLGVGQTATLTAAVLPNNATNPAVNWTTSDATVATVKDGVIVAVSPGSATITAASAADSTKAASCAVTITQTATAVTGVALDQSGLSLKVGETWQLTASVQPADAANTAVVWSSSDPAVASIVGGVVTALKPGSTIIAIASAADSTKTAVCAVTVSAGIPVQQILLSQNTLGLAAGQSATLTWLILPTDATNKKLVWTSSDASVATVKEGVITAVAPGKATVTATSAAADDTFSTCEVTVSAESAAVTGVTLDQFRLSLNEGETWKLTPTVLPENAANTSVTWTSSDPTVASILGGVVTALKPGAATITVTSVADPTKTAACLVNVATLVGVTGVKLDQSTLALLSGDTATLTATVEPAEATNRDVTWSTSNASVATVVGGVVTAKMAGKATITATSVANPALAASCTLTVTEPIPVAQLLISQSSMTLGVGATATLTTAVLPENATNKKLVWSISDTDVASVKDGVIVARHVGTATVTVASSSNAAMAASCALTVTADSVAVTGVTLDQTALTLNAGDTWKLNPAVWPAEATNTAVTWASSDTTVATISGGVVTALRTGTATIYVTSVADPGKSASCVVTIPEGTPVTGVVLSQAALSMSLKSTATLTAAVLPANASNTRLTWTSSDPEVATVKDGAITALKAGKTVVTAASVADPTKTASCEVTVANGIITVTSITLSKTELPLIVGETWKLDATILPADAANTYVTWASSDPAVATVNAGIVTAVAPGTANITVTSADGAVKTGCLVTVTTPPTVTSVTLSNSDLLLNVGDLWQLTPTVLPENAVDKAIHWASSNPEVATVENGIVTAKAPGLALIFVATWADATKSACCPVTVTTPPTVTSVTLSNSDLLLNVGDLWQLTPTMLPENAVDKAIHWASSNPEVATVENGIVTAKAPGLALIFVATWADATKSACCPVTVLPGATVQSVSFTNPDLTLKLGDMWQLSAVVLPENATNKALTWASTNPAVVTVQNGILTAVGGGTAVITATSVADPTKVAYCPVSVTAMRQYPLARTGSNGTLTLTLNDQVQLLPQFATLNGWVVTSAVSSRSSVATINAQGIVSAVGEGKARITVRTANGKKAKLTIQVVNPYRPNAVGIVEGSSYTLRVGQSLQLHAALAPATAVTNLSWSSNKTKVAPVSTDGLVVALKRGRATITVRTSNGKRSKIKITVVD